jgi:hypothetical protein
MWSDVVSAGCGFGVWGDASEACVSPLGTDWVWGAWVRDSRDASPFAHHACPLWGWCATNGGMRVPVGDGLGVGGVGA